MRINFITFYVDVGLDNSGVTLENDDMSDLTNTKIHRHLSNARNLGYFYKNYEESEMPNGH